MSGKAALKPVLPELGEPRVAGVGAEPELQEVVVEGGDLFRLQLHSDAAHSLLLVSLHHLNSVCPAVTAERNTLQLVLLQLVCASHALILHLSHRAERVFF